MSLLEMDPRQRLLMVITLMLAATMQALDNTIANVALPHMQGALSTTQEQISWVLTSYIVASAIMTPPTGFIAGRIGRKNFLLIAITGFTVSSMLCGISENLAEMVVFRLIQGCFGAALMPLSQSILLDSYPKEQHGSAMAFWGVGFMLGPILGPTLGGYLTEYMNWRWVFYINVPLGLISFLGIAALMPESDRDWKRPFDAVGFTLLAVAIGAMQLALDRGNNKDWLGSPEIVIEVTAAAIALYFFAWRMFTSQHPFIDRRVFKDRNFVVGILLAFVIGMLILSVAALLPPFLQNIRGVPVETTGLLLMPRGVGVLITMFVVGRIVNKVDPRKLIAMGIFLVALSLWEMSKFNMYVDFGPVIWTGFLQGVGLGQVFLPMTTMAYATLAPNLRTEAAGLFSLMRNIGSSIGISVAFTLVARGTQVNHSVLVQHINPYNPILHGLSLFGRFDKIFGTSSLAIIDAEITRQAATISFMNIFMVMAIVSLMCLPFVAIMKRPERFEPPPDAAFE